MGEVSTMGNPCPCPADLATSQVGLPQKEEVVELPLFASCRVSLIFMKLLVAQSFESFAFPACLLKDLLLLVS